MRVNIYAEEITGETSLEVKAPEGMDVQFYGIRMYLDSPSVLHHTEDDDDRSAITLWVPWTKDGGHDWTRILTLLDNLVSEVEKAEAVEFERKNREMEEHRLF
jgi:hypothetical protein